MIYRLLFVTCLLMFSCKKTEKSKNVQLNSERIDLDWTKKINAEDSIIYSEFQVNFKSPDSSNFHFKNAEDFEINYDYLTDYKILYVGDSSKFYSINEKIPNTELDWESPIFIKFEDIEKVKFIRNDITLSFKIDTTQLVKYPYKNEQLSGYPLYLINNSNQWTSINGGNLSLPFLMEAKDKNGKWRDIEWYDRDHVSHSIAIQIVMKPHSYLVSAVQIINGDLETKVRLKTRLNDSIEYLETFNSKILKKAFDFPFDSISSFGRKIKYRNADFYESKN